RPPLPVRARLRPQPAAPARHPRRLLGRAALQRRRQPHDDRGDGPDPRPPRRIGGQACRKLHPAGRTRPAEERMTVAILETGYPPRELIDRWGRYDAMFADLLGDGFETESFKVYHGDMPDDPECYQGLLITGSPAGVYDGTPWIAPFEAF